VVDIFSRQRRQRHRRKSFFNFARVSPFISSPKHQHLSDFAPQAKFSPHDSQIISFDWSEFSIFKQIWDSGFRIQDLRFKIQDSRFKIQDL
jgi:hypothetical protein